ncbi:MAG: PEP-CTERM sorting domain-containing protein [Verrucomicrobiales bacterium]|nr:PEP-CTERM sorting domain-containing protein [Verrucomicrobiales bacterium]
MDPSLSPHSIANANSILGLGLGDAGVLGVSTLLVDSVDYADNPGLGGITPSVANIPFTPEAEDPRFAVRYSGYLNVTSDDTYVFSVLHDDGFQLSLGGELVSVFDGDTGPIVTLTAPLALSAGLYPISLLGWEQGGVFINELGWSKGSAGAFTVPDSSVLFSRAGVAPVPEPGTWVAMGSLAALMGGAWMRRRGQSA